jgi:hypothetical protein
MKLLCIILLTGLSSGAFAQSNYHDGYVIKNNGDTLKGFVDYRRWAVSPKSVDFKSDKTDKRTQKFNAHMVKKFGITGMDTYITYQGLISTGRTKFPDLPNGLDTGTKQDTIFLRQLVTGRHLTLFFHEDAIKTRFFIAGAGGQPVELQYFQYFDYEKTVEKNTYKGQLLIYINEFMPGNVRLNSKVEDVRYNEGDLEAIVTEINGEAPITKRKSVFRFYGGVGLDNTTIRYHDGTREIEVPVTEANITNQVITGLSVTKYTTASTPKFDVGIDLFTNPAIQRLVFRTDLAFSYASGAFQYDIFNYNVDGNIPFHYSFTQYSVVLTPQILYNIVNRNTFKFYIDGGMGLNFSGYTHNAMQELALKSFWPNFPIQAGIILNKKIEISFTYTGYATYTQFASGNNILKNQSTSIGFKYLLGSK